MSIPDLEARSFLVRIPLKMFKWQNSTLPIMLPSASDATGINHHGTGVEIARCEQNMNSTNPFCQRRNFVDGVYISFSASWRMRVPNLDWAIQETLETLKNSRKKGGTWNHLSTFSESELLGNLDSRGPGVQPLQLSHVSRSSCMGARVPRIPKGKDISGHCIEDGFQRHLVSESTWWQQSFSCESIWFLDEVRCGNNTNPPFACFLLYRSFCCIIQSNRIVNHPWLRASDHHDQGTGQSAQPTTAVWGAWNWSNWYLAFEVEKLESGWGQNRNGEKDKAQGDRKQGPSSYLGPSSYSTYIYESPLNPLRSLENSNMVNRKMRWI